MTSCNFGWPEGNLGKALQLTTEVLGWPLVRSDEQLLWQQGKKKCPVWAHVQPVYIKFALKLQYAYINGTSPSSNMSVPSGRSSEKLTFSFGARIAPLMSALKCLPCEPNSTSCLLFCDSLSDPIRSIHQVMIAFLLWHSADLPLDLSIRLLHRGRFIASQPLSWYSITLTLTMVLLYPNVTVMSLDYCDMSICLLWKKAPHDYYLWCWGPHQSLACPGTKTFQRAAHCLACLRLSRESEKSSLTYSATNFLLINFSIHSFTLCAR